MPAPVNSGACIQHEHIVNYANDKLSEPLNCDAFFETELTTYWSDILSDDFLEVTFKAPGTCPAGP
jgi:hypothetical protein